jgi:hypothetical protein
VEIRPPIPFPNRPTATFDARRDADVIDANLEDWVWAMRLEEELDYALLVRDNAAGHRQRLVGRVRIVAVLAVLAAVATVVQLALHVGVWAAVVAGWAAPVVVLGVVLAAEKLLLRVTD